MSGDWLRLDMLSNFAELFDLAVTLAYAVLGAGLVGTGVLTELRSVATLGSGELILGAWFAVIGVVAIAAGTMLFTDKVRARVGSGGA
ncbi:hypothetical protein [Halobacterium noricense]|uniref:hypothetical protein n=1 Tax=Halobacterium noricense TaxID=223182 RepID=UPI001E3240C6|nr:hypothetical protein [Halobacterium noricense]UHH25125.1 hypothetical protein LT974_14245 [Halobacterium noricense]